MDDDTLAAEAPAPDQPAEAVITLDEFCTRHSRRGSGGQTEMLGAFHQAETQAATHKDTEAAYRERYTAFAAAPVKEG